MVTGSRGGSRTLGELRVAGFSLFLRVGRESNDPTGISVNYKWRLEWVCETPWHIGSYYPL